MARTMVHAGDRRVVAVGAGLALGAGAGICAVLIALAGPVLAVGAVIALGAAFYILRDLHGALYVMLAVVALIPFGKVPLPVSPSPTFLDGALIAFFAVYTAQWMTGQRRLFRASPLTPVVLGFVGLMLFAFLMGLRHAALDMRTLRTVAEMVISLMLIPVLVDVMRTPEMLRRAVAVLILTGAAGALVGILLWALPDPTAEALLNSLGRFEYPVGGVLRYREAYGSVLNERAIGLWIDPNAFGGFLLMLGAVTAPQVFARRPVLPKWAAAGSFALIALALFLTDSRGAMLSLGAALGFIALLRYRRLLWIMLLAAALALVLPVTQRYIEKLQAGLTNEDVETQMRWGEYKDALTLIERYPVIGVGFSGTPQIDLYLGVANTYLTIASNAGLVGLAAYLLMMGGALAYGLAHRAQIRADARLDDVLLGLAAGIVGVLVGGMFDHYYFKIDLFHATMTLVWILLGLMLAAARLALESAAPASPARG